MQHLTQFHRNQSKKPVEDVHNEPLSHEERQRAAVQEMERRSTRDAVPSQTLLPSSSTLNVTGMTRQSHQGFTIELTPSQTLMKQRAALRRSQTVLAPERSRPSGIFSRVAKDIYRRFISSTKVSSFEVFLQLGSVTMKANWDEDFSTSVSPGTGARKYPAFLYAK